MYDTSLDLHSYPDSFSQDEASISNPATITLTGVSTPPHAGPVEDKISYFQALPIEQNLLGEPSVVADQRLMLGDNLWDADLAYDSFNILSLQFRQQMEIPRLIFSDWDQMLEELELQLILLKRDQILEESNCKNDLLNKNDLNNDLLNKLNNMSKLITSDLIRNMN